LIKEKNDEKMLRYQISKNKKIDFAKIIILKS